ncbi:class I ribonucleotide reductase maintenance protein YfaE [Corallincola platygyrae]|uniref:Class I ribonucleotide reductase maintenance protein YfaE n=1 Tax=Corallincola platygyrae TaxID=1193278 RepID=A0ABW4XN47_9GAMM
MSESSTALKIDTLFLAEAAADSTSKYAPTLLQQMEAEGVEVAYQCREGYCGRCRCKKLSGEVTYQSPPIAWVNPDEVLPCCCVAKTDVVIELT